MLTQLLKLSCDSQCSELMAEAGQLVQSLALTSFEGIISGGAHVSRVLQRQQ